MDGKPRLVKVLPDLRQSQDRRADPAGEHVEGDEFTHRQVAAHHKLGAVEERRRCHELADELDGLAGDIAEAQDAETGCDITGELFLPAALHLRFDRHRLQRLNTGDAFDEKRLVLGAAPKLLIEPAAKERR